MHDVSAMPARVEAFLGCRVLSYEPMSGGYSRLMARAEVEWDRPDGPVKERLVLRGDPPPGQAMLTTDRDLEWSVLQALGAHGGVRMPAARWYDADGVALGTKAIVLDHCDGPSLQSVIRTSDAEHRAHAERVCDTLASIHALPLEALPASLERPDDWSTYIGGLCRRWSEAEAAHVEANPTMRYVGAWLDAHRPPPLPFRLCHGDYQAANLHLEADGGLSVIDWEFAHVGDPREDLGWYNVYSSASPPNLLAVDPEAFLARYRERTGFGEDAVNQLTLGYFTILATVTIFSNLLAQVGAMGRGENSGVMTTYSLNSLTYGHGNFLHGIRQLEQAMEAAS